MNQGRRKVRRALEIVEPRRAARFAPLGLACLTHTPHVPVPPARLACEPSNACPMDCRACGRREWVRDERNLDPASFEMILKSIRPRIVHFHGSGEPLIHPEIGRLCSTAAHAGCAVTLVTSLPAEQMMNQALQSLPHLDRLVVGFDAATPGTYGLVRTDGGLPGLQERFRTLHRLRSGHGNGRPELVASFLILRDNHAEAAEFVEMARDLGADAAIFLTLDLRSIENRRPILIGDADPEAILESLRRAKAAAGQYGLATNLGRILARPGIIRHRYGEGPLPAAGPCLRPWISTYLTADAKIRPCSRYSHESVADLGDPLREDFLREIWNGAAYQELRHDLRSGRPSFHACPGCAAPAEEGTLLENLWRRVRQS